MRVLQNALILFSIKLEILTAQILGSARDQSNRFQIGLSGFHANQRLM
jgi:hypothetical protein